MSSCGLLLGALLLVAFAAFATPAAAQLPTWANATLQPGYNCKASYNKLIYRTDSQVIANSNRFRLNCPFPSSCNCTRQYWVVAPWFYMNATASNGSLVGYTTQTWAPSWPGRPYQLDGTMTRDSCCASCQSMNKNAPNVIDPATGRQAVRCRYWQHYIGPVACGVTTSADTMCGKCIIYPGGAFSLATPFCNNGSAPLTGVKALCNALNVSVDATGSPTGVASSYSTVGMGCPGGRNDPHFIGARGTHFDFNGQPDKSFCLITDQRFHINMQLVGYYDDRTVGASILKNGKAVRTWIKTLGIVWLDADNGKHTFKIWARDGKSEKREEGYVGGIEHEGKALPRMTVGDVATLAGGVTVKFLAHEKQGSGYFDVDAYELYVPGVVTVDIKLRVAHPLLQTKEDAMAHINVRFMAVDHGDDIHGVLGQTFREGREQRAMDYTALAALIGRTIPADGEQGKGFLDGSATDYITSDVLSTNCKYSAFGGGKLPV